MERRVIMSGVSEFVSINIQLRGKGEVTVLNIIVLVAVDMLKLIGEGKIMRVSTIDQTTSQSDFKVALGCSVT
jgi:hypothetical protein